MPYCQECGSYFEGEAVTCSSCGGYLNLVQKAVAPPDKDFEETVENPDGLMFKSTELSNSAISSQANELEKPKPLEYSGETKREPTPELSQGEYPIREEQGMGWRRYQVDTHLGKGLIKPVAIENCMDGVHFKYDEPPRPIMKQPELSKEKIVEFRLSGEAELKTESKSQVETVPETVKAIEIEPKRQDEEFPVEPSVVVEPKLEESIPEDEDSEGTGESSSPEPSSSGEELIPELKPSEPEIKTVKEPELLWEGRRTWYGLPLNEYYRITDHAVILLKEDGQKKLEIDWNLISGFTLKQSWFTKLLDIGDLTIIGKKAGPLAILAGIAQPAKIQKMLAEFIDSKV